MTAIAVETPQSVGGSWRARGRSLVKSTLLPTLSSLPMPDLELLEDPLAQCGDGVWQQTILCSVRHRLDDPCGLVDDREGELPRELHGAPASRPILAMIGRSDTRKRLPLVRQAWRLVYDTTERDSVVSGKQTPAVSSWPDLAGRLPRMLIWWIATSPMPRYVEKSGE